MKLEYFIIALGVLLLEALREFLFGKVKYKKRSKTFLIAVGTALGAALIPYFVEGIRIILILEGLLLLIFIWAINEALKTKEKPH